VVSYNLQDGFAQVVKKLIARIAARRLDSYSKNRFVQLVEEN